MKQTEQQSFSVEIPLNNYSVTVTHHSVTFTKDGLNTRLSSEFRNEYEPIGGKVTVRNIYFRLTSYTMEDREAMFKCLAFIFNVQI